MNVSGFLSQTFVLFLNSSQQVLFFLLFMRTHIFDYISGSILWAWVGYFPSGITLSLHIFFFF